MADSRWSKQMLTRSPEGGKRRESPEMVRKLSGKGDEAEEFNSWEGSSYTNMAQSNWETVNGETLEN